MKLMIFEPFCIVFSLLVIFVKYSGIQQLNTVLSLPPLPSYPPPSLLIMGENQVATTWQQPNLTRRRLL